MNELRLGRPVPLTSLDEDETEGLYLDAGAALKEDVLGLGRGLRAVAPKPVEPLPEQRAQEPKGPSFSFPSSLMDAPVSVRGTKSSTPKDSGPSFAFPSALLDEAPVAEKPKEKDSGDFMRSVRGALGQTPAMAQGLVGFVGDVGERALGEGGIFSGLKKWGLEGYQKGMEEISAQAKDTDEFTVAWDKAKKGDLGALVDWAQYGLGQLTGNVAETALTAVIGGAAGAMIGGPAAPATGIVGAAGGVAAKTATKGFVKNLIEGMVEKEAVRLAAGKEVTEEVAKQATRNVAKGIGASTALAASGIIKETGGIYGDAVEEANEQGRELDAGDLARIFGAGVAAGLTDAAVDRLGLGVAAGRIKIPGGGRAGRAIVGGAIGGGIEGGTEVIQTALERFGAGKAMTGEEAIDEYINTFALGALGGGTIGGVAGAFRKGQIDRSKLDEYLKDAEKQVASDDGRQELFDSMAQDERLAQILAANGIESADDPRFQDVAIRAIRRQQLLSEFDEIPTDQERAENRKQRGADIQAAFGDTASTGTGVGTGATDPVLRRDSVVPNEEERTLEPASDAGVQPVTLPGQTGDTSDRTLAMSPEDIVARGEGYEVMPTFKVEEFTRANRFVSEKEAGSLLKTLQLGNALEQKLVADNFPTEKQRDKARAAYNETRAAVGASPVTDWGNITPVFPDLSTSDFQIRRGKRSKDAGGGTFFFIESRAAENPQPIPTPDDAPETPEAKPTPPQGAKPGEAPSAPATPATPTTPAVAVVGPALPSDLAGAKPRYGAGKTGYTLTFESDVDRALYIVAQERPSSRDADYRLWLGKVTGMDNKQIDAFSKQVKATIKARIAAGMGKDGNLTVRPVFEIPTPPADQSGAATTGATTPPTGINSPTPPTGNVPTVNPTQQSDAGQDEEVKPAAEPVTVTSERRVKDESGVTATTLSLSNGDQVTIGRLNATESMGLPGWHDFGDVGEGKSSYLGDTKEQAIAELLRRASEKPGKPKKNTKRTSEDAYNESLAIRDQMRGLRQKNGLPPRNGTDKRARYDKLQEDLDRLVNEFSTLKQREEKKARDEKEKADRQARDPDRKAAIEFWEDQDDGEVAHVPFKSLTPERQAEWVKAHYQKKASAELHDTIVASQMGTEADLRRSETKEPSVRGIEPTAATVQDLVASVNRKLERSGQPANFSAARVPLGDLVGRLPGVGLIEKTAKLFGKKVVFFRVGDGSPDFFDGAVLPTTTTIFVNVNASRAHMRIFGHELVHAIRNSDQKTYRKLVQALAPMLDSQGYDAHVKKQKGYGLANDEKILEEAIGDIVGDRFGENEFWQMLADENPSTFKQVAKAVLDFIDNFLAKLKGKQTLGSETLIKDLRRAREQIASILSDVAPKETARAENTGFSGNVEPSERRKAERYAKENGILPYVSEGQIDIPVESAEDPAFSIKAPYTEAQIRSAKKDGKTLRNHPVLGLPMNQNGTVTLYFPTTNDDARRVVRERTLKGKKGANRIYLTNESSAAEILANRGGIEQDVGGANILVQVDPNLLQVDQEFENGRRDFFIPIAEGNTFREKMKQTKLFTLNKSRKEGVSESATIGTITKGVTKGIEAYKAASPTERRKLVAKARALLKREHNVGTLLGENGKLEKTRVGEYGLTYEGKSVASMGLGLASAQRINNKNLTTCPLSAACERLCLGETSGHNLLYGGEGSFRSGPRLSQYLKTEAMIVNPEAFSIVLADEIAKFRAWANAETEFKKIEGKRTRVEKQQYAAAIRLNVTSDFPPRVFEALIEANPDVMFYDYTKLFSNDPIAKNHHLTYSSTGFSQRVGGKVIDNPNSNWPQMFANLLEGKNVAMAFSSRTAMPSFIVDEETGRRFRVWNGDNYDARFLDPKQPDGIGMIIGLTNKDRTGDPEKAAEDNDGFFVDYDPARDGDTVTVPKLPGNLKPKKVIGISASPAFSMKRGDEADDIAFSRKQTETPEFKKWFGKSKAVDGNGGPLMVYRGEHGDGDGNPKTMLGSITFVDDPGVANVYATEPNDRDTFYKAESPRVIPAFLKIENPIINTPDDPFIEMSDLIKKIGREETEQIAREYGEYIENTSNWQDNFEDYETVDDLLDAKPKALSKLYMDAYPLLDDPDFVRLAKAKGYDGAIHMGNGESFDSVEYRVFDKSQIKSAVGNSGAFDPNNDDIAFSRKQTETPQFKRWFGKSKVVDESGQPMVVYHGTFDDFSRFSERKLGKNTDDNASSEAYAQTARVGFWFNTNPMGQTPEKYGAGYTVDMPVYLSIQNPYREMSLDWLAQGLESTKGRAYRRRLIEEGYDGIVLRDEEFGGESWIAFRPEQIKSAIGNNGAFDPANPDITFSRKQYEAQVDDLPKDVQDMVLAKGFASPPTIRERLDSLKPKLKERIVQGMFDKFRAVKDISMKAYIMLRMSNGPMDGTVASLLHYGQVFNDDGALNVKKGTKGLLEALAPVGPEVDRFLIWIAANRAEQLSKEERERFFSPEQIKALKRINLGTMKDGKSRPAVYAEALRQMNELNRSVLDVARQTGLIDDAAYKRFSSDIWYVPFYRQMEDDGSLSGAQTSSGAVGQYLSKNLKGSERPLNDLMENVLMNWSHILSASMRNAAAVETLTAANQMGGVVTKVTPVDSERGRTPSGEIVRLKGTVKVMEGGKEMRYQIDDELVLAALSAVSSIPQNGFLTNIGRQFKTMLTRGVSLAPTFKINNLIRDSIQAIGLSELKANPVTNVIQGLSAYKNDRAEALAAGGLFAMGNAYDGDQSANIRRLLKAGVRDETILTTPEKAASMIRKLGDKYDEVSDAMENANRLALYKQLRDQGVSHLEAAYAARDLQDFSLQGGWPVIRYAAMLLPYFNARLQGMYKLGRDGVVPTVQFLKGDASQRQKAAKFSAVLGAVTTIGLLLYLSQKDDEEWKRREDWDRDSFFWLRVPGTDTALRIPKPFEMGAFASIIERLTEQMVDDGVEGKVFGKRLMAILSDNLAINPVPQIVRPLEELRRNKSGFTDRPIESEAMRRLSPENRVGPQTSTAAVAMGTVNAMFANFASKVTGVNADSMKLSPIQYDYLVRGYLGWLGTAILTTSEMAVTPFKAGEAPDRKLDQMFVVGTYLRDLPSSQSKYVTNFYENARQISTAVSDYKAFVAAQKMDEAKSLWEDKGALISMGKFYAKQADKLAELNKEIKRISADTKMPGDEKRIRIDRLEGIRNEIAKNAEVARIARARQQ